MEKRIVAPRHGVKGVFSALRGKVGNELWAFFAVRKAQQAKIGQ